MDSRSTASRAFGSGAAIVLVLSLANALVPALARAGDRDAGLARMAGVWQLDQRVSDDPRRLLRPPERQAAPGREGEKPPQDFSQRAKLVIEGANVLTFAYTDGALTVTDWHDEELTLVVDGKKHAMERQGVPVEVEAGWKSSDRLVVKTTGAPGGWIRETYELGQRDTKLFVTVELQRRGSKYPLRFERLYNRSGGP